MGLLDALRARVSAPSRLLLPEGEDPRVQEAALRLAAEGLAHPVLLLADRAAITDRAARLGLDADRAAARMDVLDPDAVPGIDGYVASFAEARGLTPGVATRLLRRRPYLAAAMLAGGAADAMLAGVTHPTRDVITACHAVLGLAPGCTFPSSFFVMDVPGGAPLIFTDCAVTENPTAEQLAEIAIVSAGNARHLPDLEPRVALLSFSTLGSADHPDVEKVRAAVAIARERAPNLAIDGELQADAALDATVAAVKLSGSTGAVAGRANVLVFPDLDAGNIGYKLVRHFGRVAAFGSFLQGFPRPVCDASRGATADDLVGTAVILGFLAGGAA